MGFLTKIQIKKSYQLVYNRFRTFLEKPYHSLKRVFAYSKPYISLIIIGNSALLLATICSIFLPNFIGKVHNAIESDHQIENLKGVILNMALVLFGNVLFLMVRDFTFALLSIKVTADMRKDLFKSLVNKDIEFYDYHNSGDLMSRLTGDIERIHTSSMSDISTIVRRIFELCGSFFFLLYISPKLTLILFVFIPVKIFLIGMTGYLTGGNSKFIRRAIADANSTANEAFQNIRIIKAFSTEEKEYNTYITKLSINEKSESANLLIHQLVSVIRSILAYSSLLFMIYVGGNMIVYKEIASGDLTTFMLTGLNASMAFNSLDKAIQRVAASVGACNRIFEILDYEPRIQANCENGKTKQNLEGEITMNNMVFTYPTKRDVTVLRQLDVKIKKGETIALVGSSGSGKTTFTSLIQRFYDVTKGDLLIDGESVSNYNLKWLHQQIGYVPQEPSLFSGTIEENITYGVSSYSKEDLDHVIRMANATFVYDKLQFPLGLQTTVGERGAKLSGGQKQRIAIARAIIKNPKILIFDEATSALDAESEHQVQKAIDSLMTEEGKTLLIIAHRLSTIINCKRILVFEHGKIVEEGNHKELLKAGGVYKNLVERQLAGFDL